MIPYLFQIYGPFYANCYGLAILLGILTFLWFTCRDKKLLQLTSKNEIINITAIGTLIGIVGGAVLWGVHNWQELDSCLEILQFWRGGFSILGTIMAVALFIPFYLMKKNIPVLPFLDRVAVYAPLTQAIARIGCFFAGCCHGEVTNFCLGVTYTHPDSMAPLHVKVHPTQLYSSVLLFLIFIFMYFFAQKRFVRRGQLTSAYLFMAGLERFLIDFIRGDKSYFFFQKIYLITSNQCIALIIMLVAFCLFLYYSFHEDRKLMG